MTQTATHTLIIARFSDEQCVNQAVENLLTLHTQAHISFIMPTAQPHTQSGFVEQSRATGPLGCNTSFMLPDVGTMTVGGMFINQFQQVHDQSMLCSAFQQLHISPENAQTLTDDLIHGQALVLVYSDNQIQETTIRLQRAGAIRITHHPFTATSTQHPPGATTPPEMDVVNLRPSLTIPAIHPDEPDLDLEEPASPEDDSLNTQTYWG